jgi:hypothetical protein
MYQLSIVFRIFLLCASFLAVEVFSQTPQPRSSTSSSTLQERVRQVVKNPERCERKLGEILNRLFTAERISDALSGAPAQVDAAEQEFLSPAYQRQITELDAEITQKIASVSNDGSGSVAAEYRELHGALLGMREQMQRAGPAASSASNKAKDLRRFIQECTRVLPVVARISGGEDAAAFVRSLLKNRAAAWGGIQAPPTVKPVIPEKPTAPNKTQALKVDLTDGVTVGDFGPQQARSWNLPEGLAGALVLNVKPSSIAAKHGIQPGDIILELDHQFVRNAEDAVRVSEKVVGKAAAWVRIYKPAAANIRGRWVDGSGSGEEKVFLLQANQPQASVAGNGSPAPAVEAKATPEKASPVKVAPVSAPPKAQEVSAAATAPKVMPTPPDANQSEPAPEASRSWIGALLICFCALFIGGADLKLVSLLAAAAAVYFFPWLTVSFTAKMCFAALAVICPISRNS